MSWAPLCLKQVAPFTNMSPVPYVMTMEAELSWASPVILQVGMDVPSAHWTQRARAWFLTSMLTVQFSSGLTYISFLLLLQSTAVWTLEGDTKKEPVILELPGEECGLWCQTNLGLSPTSNLCCCVISGKSLTFSDPLYSFGKCV